MGVKVSLLTLTLLPVLLCPRANAQEWTDLLHKPIDSTTTTESIAQAIPPGLRPTPSDLRPSEQPEPPEDLLEPSQPPSSTPEVPLTPNPEETIEVTGYTIVGSTVFSPEELAAVTQPFTGSVSFAQLLQVRSAVTQLYIDKGYITSGAFLPEQTLQNGQVTIQVIEGRLSEINVNGLGRLNPKYVRDRVRLAAGVPVNVNDLVQGLQLLQLDPHIANISAELSAGVNPGESILELELVQAPSFNAQMDLNNGRVPSVGSFRRQVTLQDNTLFGQGDNMLVRYGNTDGSNAVDVEYTYPVNPRNGTVRLLFSHSDSRIIEEPFDVLGIRSTGQTWEVAYRQPIFQTPTQEFATGLSLGHRSTATSLLLPNDDDRVGFPLSEGANEEGKTRVSVLRFTQEWTKRGANQVVGARSQFNVGLNWLGATDNPASPDSEFFSWQGQAQWVRQLAPDTLLLLRGNLQLADRPLLSLEQFGLGGFESIRGYRQDQLLTDNGLYGSIEARIPIFRIPKIQSVAQITPFLDWGTGWNSGDRADPEDKTLASIGLGLRWQFSDWATARLEWGIPLINSNSSSNSLQESGVLFSLTSNVFK
jgi:hemolysin activation/secretion protein